MTEKVILLDRDGVINHDLKTSVRSVEQLILFPRSLAAIVMLKTAGYRILVVTNQACVGRGEVSTKMLNEIHSKINTAIASKKYCIDDLYICTHTPEHNCNCRKPDPGLIFQAQKKWQFDTRQTFFVGDDVRDIEAAINSGCRPVLVLTGKGKATNKLMPDIPFFKDLLEFVEDLVSEKMHL